MIAGLEREEFWQRKPIGAIRSLVELRAVVLAHNAKRCPKWQFRLDEDLAVQLQPRPVPRIDEVARAHGVRQQTVLFFGIAVCGRELPTRVFSQSMRELASLKFKVYAYEGDAMWTFHHTHIHWPRRPEQYAGGGWREFPQRVLSALARLDHLDPAMMFQPACLFCGKALTDPVSMARWIGPECAGTASLDSVLKWRVAA